MKNTEKYKVSVIVPVYRVEKYVDRCMNSLMKQTLKDIQIVCICEKEDGSYGRLLEYEKADNRVLVVEKKNTGVSSARNAGIKAAEGKYIAFVDADDWIERYALETLYKTAEKYSAQIIAYGIWPTVEPKGDKRGMFTYSTYRNVMYRGKGMMALFYERGSRPYIGNKFYNREFLNDNHALFDESLDIGEDQLLQFELFGKAKTVCFVKDKLYHYDIARNSSAMNSCEEQQKIVDKNFKLLEKVMAHKEEIYGNRFNREYVSWILQDFGWLVNQDVQQITEDRKKEILVIQNYLQSMSAEEHIGDMPEEYQKVCERFLKYDDSVMSYEAIAMPYKAYEAYRAGQVEGMYEKIVVNEGIFDKVKRIYEAVVFHEFRHLVVKALVRFGLF